MIPYFSGHLFDIGSIPIHMFGVLVASTVSGLLITRTGTIKPFIVTGTIVLVAGFAMLAAIDHRTSLVYVGAGMLLIGVGVGMTLQNLILAVQNTVALRDLGAASGAVTFFRSLGGTIGVAVLGAILARRVSTTITTNLAAAGVPVNGNTDGIANLDLNALPAPILAIVRAAYGDATGHIFLVSAGIGLVGIVAALLLPRIVLRSSLDLPASGPASDDPIGLDGLPETEEAITSTKLA